MTAMEPKHSKRNLLEDSDSESDDGGAPVGETFKVNQEFARRFEHNKKREEQQKLEEKYKKGSSGKGGDNDDETSSSDETEDDEGFLATEALDAQISATLQALRTKDPRVYDKDVTFYQAPESGDGAPGKAKKEKPVYLKDYHREKLLRGDVGGSDDEDQPPPTYLQEQDALKKSIVSEINAADNESGSDEEDDEDDAFMKRKQPAKAAKGDSNGVHPSRAAAVKVADLDVTNAERDPETYLSNFMNARAWVPEDGGRWKAFESDDGEDDDMADQFEQAYNLRFEDPEKSNEVLQSYSRQLTAARSVRREEKTGRQRQRDLERERKEEEKKAKHSEKARLRKLKLDEAEERLRKVKQAAGAVGKNLTDEEWMTFLNDAWENDKWEEEMQRRFGDDYYAVEEGIVRSEDEDDAYESSNKKAKKPKKPKWDDDIDIKDIIPDFEDAKPEVALSDSGAQEDDDDEDNEEDRPSKKRKTADHKRERTEMKKKARQERTKLEALVDSKLELSNHDLLSGADERAGGGFRYRETSPQSFGMTARDILLAPSDQDLNSFAGLKKLATFRDEDKKRRDKKHLGKKARLRQWRRDVFGGEFERTGPTYGFEKLAAENAEEAPGRVVEPAQGDENVVGDVGGSRKKKRKRSKGKKGASAEAS